MSHEHLIFDGNLNSWKDSLLLKQVPGIEPLSPSPPHPFTLAPNACHIAIYGTKVNSGCLHQHTRLFHNPSLVVQTLTVPCTALIAAIHWNSNVVIFAKFIILILTKFSSLAVPEVVKLLVQPVMKILSIWWHFYFSAALCKETVDMSSLPTSTHWRAMLMFQVTGPLQCICVYIALQTGFGGWTANWDYCKTWTRRYKYIYIYIYIYIILRLRQNGHYFADDIFKRIFFNENIWISFKICLKFVSMGQINNIPALVQIMAWCRPGDKPLSETMMISLPYMVCIYVSLGLNEVTHWGRVTHICVNTNTNIGSDNGLSPGWRQAIIWTNAGILLIWTLEQTSVKS